MTWNIIHEKFNWIINYFFYYGSNDVLLDAANFL